MVQTSAADKVGEARSELSSPEIIAESRDFLRETLASTPLRRYTQLLEPGGSVATDAIDECLGDGFGAFRSDASRWGRATESPAALFDRLRLAPNLQASYFYRVTHALFVKQVELLPSALAAVSRLVTGVEIYYSARIEPGLKVIHGLGTVIGAHCVIGSHFTVYQGVTVGDKLGRDTGHRPVIGDHVIVSAGAQILGPVSIGSSTVVGANAVVLDSLPDRCIAAGAPARVKKSGLSEEEFREYWDAVEG